jgi:hypothetical protein
LPAFSGNEINHRRDLICQIGRNRWRRFDRLVNADEVLMEIVQRNRVFVIVQLFAESVG